MKWPHPLRGLKRPALTSWRQRALSVIMEIEAEKDNLLLRSASCASPIAGVIDEHLSMAQDSASRGLSFYSGWFGSDVTAAWSNINSATVNLLRLSAHLASKEELRPWGPRVLAEVQSHLGEGDPRRRILEHRLTESRNNLSRPLVPLAVEALRAAFAVLNAKRDRVRSFRNSIIVAFIILTGIAIGWAFLGIFSWQADGTLCFADPACPLGGKPAGLDIPYIELVGMTAAALVGAIALRHLDGTAQPFAIAQILLLLKLPAGATSAILGLLLVKGHIVPGIDPFHSTGDILAWAAIFGASQELVTRLVDDRGRTVLHQARNASSAFWSADEEGRTT